MSTRSAVMRCQRGLTLIELMIAMVIGMLLLTVIATVMITSESSRRTTTSLNDISQSGGYAVFMLDTWIRGAGSGFAQTAARAYGCPLLVTKSGTKILPRSEPLPAPFAGLATTVRLAPVLIAAGGTTPGASGQASDVLYVMEGAAGGAETYSPVQAAPGADALTLKNTQGYTGNDMVLLVDQLTAGSNTDTCVIDQVASGFTGSEATSLRLSGTYHAGGSTLTGMTDATVVTDLGNITNSNPPRFNVIGVGDNNVLYAYDLLQTGDSPLQSLADGVFELHALYGVDTDDDEKINTWISPEAGGDYAYEALTAGTSTAASRLQHIKAVRIGLILRTALREKPGADDKPTTHTPDSITLFGDLDSSLQYTRSFTLAEKQYRYRSVEVSIPVRNNLML